jgi:hypothetical protein
MAGLVSAIGVEVDGRVVERLWVDAIAGKRGGRQSPHPRPGLKWVTIQVKSSRLMAFSSEVDTGSREENASKQKARAPALIPSKSERP